MLTLVLAIAAISFLAFSNGGNDNIKGVATLLGSRTTSYRAALAWATVTTLAGSLCAVILAQKLLTNFSGKGLVPNDIAMLPTFALAVVLAAVFTVFLATLLGFPISTTHALTGGLVGAGLVASPTGVDFSKLVSGFFLPLMISPFVAIVGAVMIYPLFSLVRRRIGVKRESCLCIGREVLMAAPPTMQAATMSATLALPGFPSLAVGTKVSCEQRYTGNVLGVTAKTALDTLHFISAGMVSFARGMNDAPKIAAILLVLTPFGAQGAIGVVAIAMAIGGLVMAKRIADRMAFQITKMNDGQAFSANLVTSSIVIGASLLGMPVSTTHVSCGALFGIGGVTRQADYKSIGKIVSSWIITLPVAGLSAMAFFFILNRLLG